MMRNATRCSIFTLFVLLIATASLSAQGITTAAMNGSVSDKSGKPIPGATVTAIHTPSGTKFGVVARGDGRFNLPNLRVGGPYTLTVTSIGFKAEKREGIFLELGQNLRITFSLNEESKTLGEVKVTAEKNAVIDASRTGAATNVSTEKIQNTPTISRSFQDLQKYTPQYSGNNAAGRNAKFNNVQIDGIQYNDLFGLGSSGTPGGQASTTPISLDAIEEFQVVVSPFDIRQSGFTGGGVNAITRSGSNTFAGSAFYFGRNQNLIGKSPDSLKTKFAEFSEYQAGARIGGPVIEDKLFFLVSGEMTKRKQPIDNLSITQAANDSVRNYRKSVANAIDSILKSRYGYDPGSFDSFSAERPSTKLFVRFDYNLSNNHRLTLRHNYVDASDDNIPRSTSLFQYADRNYLFKSNTNSTAFQLNSSFGSDMANELIVGYTRIRDERGVEGNPFPSVTVREGGVDYKFGNEEFSVANKLDHDYFEISDNFSYFMGDHNFTFGTHNEFFKFENLFIRDFYGNYTYNSLAGFRNNAAPNSFTYSFSNDTNDRKRAARFSAVQLGFYAQDEWNVMPNLRITAGIRADIPTFPDAPSFNSKFATTATKTLKEGSTNATLTFSELGYSTDKLPSGKILFSPRVGFNFDVDGNRQTQLRGGLGLFTGRVPYVWISNQYANTGVEISRVSASTNLKFIADPFNQKAATTATAGSTSEINITDPDFKMPQVLRMNLALDKELTDGWIGTVEVLYSQNINDPYYNDINLNTASAIDPKSSTSNTYRVNMLGGRQIYSGSTKISTAFTNVMLLKSTSDGYQMTISAQLQRNLAKGISGTIGYTYGMAKDRNSVTSSQAFSQMRFNPVPGNPNEAPLTVSNYDLGHRVFAGLSYGSDWIAPGFTTTFSVFYNGQSGRPYSYRYQGDVNGDTFDGNDLLYVPKDKNDILLATVNSSGVVIPLRDTAAVYQQLMDYIDKDEYLSTMKGKIVERNASREPWFNQIDVRILQDIQVIPGHKLQLTLDVLNLPNLLNNEWGWSKSVPNQTDALLTYATGTNSNNPNFPLQIDPRDGIRKPAFSFTNKENPFQNDALTSRWQMQLGVRYTF